MTQLETLSPEQRGLVVGLLYRAGIWMSHSDDEGGEDDDIKEIKALEQIIVHIAKAHEDSDFVQDVAKRVLFFKDKWPVWAEHSFDILADCEKAVQLLKDALPQRDLAAYCNAIVEIAETVAAAHGEFGGDADDSVMSGFLGRIVERLKSNAPPEKNFMNISPAEQAAIERLKKALEFEL